MSGWKIALCMTVLMFSLGNVACQAAETTSAKESEWNQINKTTEQNVQDIMSVQSDIGSLAQRHGRDFEYLPSPGKVANTPKPAVDADGERLGYSASGKLMPSQGDQNLETTSDEVPVRSVAGSTHKRGV